MKCKKYKFMASAYMDRQLTLSEADDFRAHVMECANCRAHLSETRQASLLLRNSAQPQAPRELHSYIMTAVERRAAREITLGERAYDWLLRLNPQPVSYALGLVVSAVLFTMMLWALKPVQVLGWGKPIVVEAASIEDPILGTMPEYLSYNNLPAGAEQNVAQSYVLPRVLANSALISFSHLAYRKHGPEGMAAIVEVKSDGSAKLVEVLGDRSDPFMVNQLWWSLPQDKRTFQPALINGKPVPTRIVLLVEKLDVSG